MIIHNRVVILYYFRFIYPVLYTSRFAAAALRETIK